MSPADAEALFWELVEPLYAEPSVSRSTMMGLPCVRRDGQFFASFDRRTGAMLVKLPAERVRELVTSGAAEPFAPAGRVFREWAAFPRPDRRRWRAALEQAHEFVASSAARFTGFGADGFALLAALEQDNTAAVFDAGRETYRRALDEPSRALVVALGDALRRAVSPGLRFEPKVGGSLFRITNDMRFHRDRPPYRTYVDLMFWEGDAPPRTNPALLLRVTPAEVHLGAGVAGLSGDALTRYRAALQDPARAGRLAGAVDELCAAGAELSAPTRARLPAGFAADTPAARFAVRDGFHVMRVFPRPRASESARFVAWCTERLTPFAPVHRWLVGALGSG